MPGAGSQKLYTPDVLALAVSLSAFPLTPDFTVRGEARSRACGSTLELGLSLGPDGLIERVGLAVKACAIGQAAAALFASGVIGRSLADVAGVHGGIGAWLAGEGAVPEWPGFGALEQARAYPARHGAILLPWTAAQAALGKADTTG